MAKRKQGRHRDVDQQVFVQCRPNADAQRAINAMHASIDRAMTEVPFLLSSEQSTSPKMVRRACGRAFAYFILTCLALAFF